MEWTVPSADYAELQLQDTVLTEEGEAGPELLEGAAAVVWGPPLAEEVEEDQEDEGHAEADRMSTEAVIAWNEETNEVRSGQTQLGPGYDYWLMKFDIAKENYNRY